MIGPLRQKLELSNHVLATSTGPMGPCRAAFANECFARMTVKPNYQRVDFGLA